MTPSYPTRRPSELAAQFVGNDDVGSGVDQTVDEIGLAADHHGRYGQEEADAHRHAGHGNRGLPRAPDDVLARDIQDQKRPDDHSPSTGLTRSPSSRPDGGDRMTLYPQASPDQNGKCSTTQSPCLPH